MRGPGVRGIGPTGRLVRTCVNFEIWLDPAARAVARSRSRRDHTHRALSSTATISAQRRAYPGFFIDRIDQPIAHALGARPGAPYSPAKA